jgi:hypothetical protein
VVLSETGSDHLHVIAEEVSRVAELCIGQGNPTRFFVAFRVVVGLPSLLRRVLPIRSLLPRNVGVKGRGWEGGGTHSKVLALFHPLTSIPLKSTAGQYEFRPKT